MQIFVVGGSGRVATELIKDLVTDGHQVVAGARHEDKIVKLDQVKPVHLDLHAEVDDLAKLMQGSEVVYFVAGSRGKDLLQTDAFGAVKTMQAAKKLGIKRYVMLSSLFALQPEKWNLPGLADLTDYNIAKFFADNYLVNQSGLNYTILQPSNLTEEAGTGKISLDVTNMNSNPIPDVAKTLAEIIKYDNTIGKVILMHGGDTPIDEALKSL
ncbi:MULTISPECIES: SDR family oxidoreductase [Lactobacillus]|uniref:SDR family oxidoreductase n=1 Tax=Lactobacillus xujianguonis TaxID=2495899 RepID=A0A437SSZ8_9LACO|nr:MULTISPECIES: SDR family oxidoreductase [Lactobacillus]RVU69962.1 SDR family oxidoreductase [Lactobacillus xujianguonis]RVU72349.1 SDR family oxidoreductase [Lactobacillus xujianguonis]